MKTGIKILLVAAAFFFTSKILAQEVVGNHFLRSTQVIKLRDNTTGRTYHLSIQTPHGYNDDAENQKKYPVMYLTDSPYNFPMLEGWMNVATYGSTVKKHILVGISREIDSSSKTSRSFDFTPIVDTEWTVPTGGANSHLRFIKEKVIKYIESNYSVDSNHRTYIGSSLGGLFGAYAFLTQPDLFSNYILVSPSLWYDDGYMFRLLESGRISKPTHPTKIFLSAGELETPEDAGIRNNLLTDAKKFTKIVQDWESANVWIQFHQVDGAFHSMTFPESMVKAIYWMHREERNIN